MPRTFRISRTRVLPAAPAALFSTLNDPSRWQKWNPYIAFMEPNATVSFSGPPSGVGAALEWKGGVSGRVELTESVPPDRVEFRVETAKRVTTMTLELSAGEGGGTELTWTVVGEHSVLADWISRLLGLHRLFHAQIDGGMQRLQALV